MSLYKYSHRLCHIYVFLSSGFSMDCCWWARGPHAGASTHPTEDHDIWHSKSEQKHPSLIDQFICSKTKTPTSEWSTVFNCVSLILIMFTFLLLADLLTYGFFNLFFVFNRCSFMWKREPRKHKSSLCRNQGYCCTSQSVTTLSHEQSTYYSLSEVKERWMFVEHGII